MSAKEEPEVATKAVESDSDPVTMSSIPNDTPAQTGPAMGEHCTTDRPLPDGSSAPAARSLRSTQYRATSAGQAHIHHRHADFLLLLSGGTGIHSRNNQLQADRFADKGYVVVMPDQFNGDPAPTSTTLSEEDLAEAETSLLERIKLGAAEAAKSFLIDMWLARHTPEKVLPALHKVIEGAKEAYGDAAANGGGLYGAGYCFGAKYVLLLCGNHPDSVAWGQKSAGGDVEKGEVMAGPYLKAGAVAHGTLVTKEDLEAVQAPVSLVCVANDPLFPDDIRDQGRASLELNAVDHEVRVFDAVPHGFAVLGDYESPKIKQSQEEAFDMMVRWLEKH